MRLLTYLFMILFATTVVSGGAQIKILRLAHGLDTQHPVHKALLYMAEKVDLYSDGLIKITVYPNEQLGNEKECIEALQLGYLAMTKTSTAVMESFVPKMRVFGVPYLFRDSEHFWNVLGGGIGKQLLIEGQSKQLRGLCYYDAGARSFYAKKAINHPKDLDGLKVRVQNSLMSVKMIEAMGGSPTPVSWGELYTALDQGVVDAAENNPPSICTARHYEVCRFYTMDEHTRIPDMLVISMKIWNSLSSEHQQIIQRAADESVEYQRKIWADAERTNIETMINSDVQIIRPDKEFFRESVKDIWGEFSQTEIGDLVHQIQKVADVNSD